MYDLAIVGCGAAGLFACSLLSNIKKDMKVIVLEKRNTIAQKLSISGNNQCNYTNYNEYKNKHPKEFVEEFSNHYGGKKNFVKSVLGNLTNLDLIQYFKKIGIESFIREDGKVFPRSLNSQEIINTILKQRTNNIEIINNIAISSITYTESFIILKSKQKTIQTKYLMLATGGKSYPVTGSEGDISILLKPLLIKINEFKSALSTPNISNYEYSALSGISLPNCGISLWKKDFDKAKFKIKKNLNNLLPILDFNNFTAYKPIYINTGSLLFTHKTLSGPLILDNSRYFDTRDLILIHLTNFNSIEDFSRYLEDLVYKHPKRLVKNIFNNLDIPERLTKCIMNSLPKEIQESKISDLSNEKKKILLYKFYCLIFIISSPGSLNSAMVSSGGIDTEEINKTKLCLKKYPKIYVAGECIDVDGDTGGYNIHFAFACAKTIIKDLENNILTNN